MPTTQPTIERIVTGSFTRTTIEDVPPFPFAEDMNLNFTGHGHQDRATFAAEINRYDEYWFEEPFPEDDQYTADDIDHTWAVFNPTEETYHCTLDGVPVTSATPGAAPITTLWGAR